MHWLQESFNDFIQILFPQHCIGCGSDQLVTNGFLCVHCLDSLPVTGYFSHAQNPAAERLFGRLPVRNAAAAYYFNKGSLVQRLLHELKYQRNEQVGVYLGKLVAKYISNNPLYQSIDALVPLPLNPKKQYKRGFNQSAAICQGIAEICNLPVYDKAVIRTIYTQTQTKKSRIDRWHNMDGVFAVTNEALLQNKHLLLVDDVITTGATIESCGNEILRVSGTSLSIATVALA